MIRFRYDTSRYDFSGLISYLLEAQELSRLHEVPGPLPGLPPKIRRGVMVKKLYDRRRDGFDALVQRFANEVVIPVFGPVCAYQERACLRIHMHGDDSISAFHRDRDWGQQDIVENVWVPFTRVWGNNSLWVESAPDSLEYAPLDLDYGEAVIFAGAILRHGSVANDTGATRVSADFRVMPRR